MNIFRHIPFYMALVCCLLSGGKTEAAKKINSDDIKKITENFMEGIRLNREGKYDSARTVFNEILKVRGGKEYEGGRIMVNMANSFFYQEKYVEALKYYFEALKYAERKKEKVLRKESQARAFGNIAECYYMMGNLSQALYYANQSDSLMLNTPGHYYVYFRAQALYVAGAVHLDNNEYKKAETKMKETVHVSEYILLNHNDNSMLWYKAYGLEGLSKIWLAYNDFEKAEDYALQSIEIAETYGDPAVTAKCLLALSSVYLQRKQYEQCRDAAFKATELSSEAIRLNPDLAYNIAASSMFLGNKEMADEYFRIYSNQMRKNTDRNFHETVASMGVQYETEKRQLRISALEKERLLYVGLIALICISMLSILLFWQQRMKRHRQEKSLFEMRAAARGIMEGETKERERLAVELHDGVQGMLSAVKLNLNDTEKVQVLIDKAIEEVRSISRNLMSETLKRYGLRAAVEDYCRMFPNVIFLFFGSEHHIPKHIESLLYRCTQELVTNSIKYAEAKNINVQLMQEYGRILLTVFDDGKGFDMATAVKGMGISGIHHRIDAVNGKIDITSSFENGTEITIDIKI
ncbi:MAG: tetratricopeptide repeat protein [Tannerella sp.]|jgi:signal transduction histidine kinase|nr:tetratricopeptide repeat protein [Tannerella sp.]